MSIKKKSKHAKTKIIHALDSVSLKKDKKETILKKIYTLSIHDQTCFVLIICFRLK